MPKKLPKRPGRPIQNKRPTTLKLERLNINITTALHKCLVYRASQDPSEFVGQLVERILRETPEIQQAATELKLEFADRPDIGRPISAAHRNIDRPIS